MAESNDPELEKLKLEALKAQQRAEIAKQNAVEAAEIQKKKANEKEPEIDQVSLETKMANARKAKAEAEQQETNVQKAKSEAEQQEITTLKSKFNTDATITGPTGEVTVNGQFIETQVLAHNVLKSLATKLAIHTINNISGLKSTFIIHDSSSISDLESYISVKIQLNHFKSTIITINQTAKENLTDSDFKDFIEETSKLSVDVIPLTILGLAKTAAQLASLFKKDSKFDSEDLNFRIQDFASLYIDRVNQQILIDEKAQEEKKRKQNQGGEIKKREWNFYYPAQFPVGLFNNQDSELLQTHREISLQIKMAQGNVNQLNQLITNLESLKTTDPLRYASNAGKIAKVKSFIQEMLGLIAIYEEFIKQLTVGDSVKLPISNQLLRSERLYKQMTKDSSSNIYVVMLELKARGSNKISKTLWFSPTIEHSAGVLASYTIFNKEGRIVTTTNLSEYTAYKESKNIIT